MASRRRRDMDQDELDLSQEEMEKLTTAMKDEKFHKLLREYADEITDPENVKTYEKEIKELEKERGVDVTFVRPKPNYVLKTSVDGKRKAFINISTNDNIKRPSCERGCNDKGKGGLHWSIPYSLAPPRDDWDKEKRNCLVYDVVFHPDTIYMAMKNGKFKKLIEDTAMEGIERNYKVQLDYKNVRHPRMKFKGLPVSTVIRKRSGNPPSKQDSDFMNKFVHYPPEPKDNPEDILPSQDYVRKDESVEFVEPKYIIKHRKHVEMEEFAYQHGCHIVDNTPKELSLEIELPLLSSAAGVDLDVTERNVKLESTTPAAYKLQLDLHWPVDSDKATAKFDTTKKQLIVILPVKKMATEHLSLGDGEAEFGIGNGSENNSEVLPNSEDLVVNDGNSSHQTSVMEVLMTTSDESEDDGDDDDVDAGRPSISEDVRIYVPQETYRQLPSYNVHQTHEKLVFSLKVYNVDADSVEEVTSDDTETVNVRFTSVGAGLVPVNYAICLRTVEGKSFEGKSVVVNVEEEGHVVVMVEKDAGCYGDWNAVDVGVDEDHLETVGLLTLETISEQLEKLQQEVAETTASDGSDLHPELLVLGVNEKSLELVIRPSQQGSDDDDDDDDNDAPLKDVEKNEDVGNSMENADRNQLVGELDGDLSPTSQKPRGILKMRHSSSDDTIGGDSMGSPGSPDSSAADIPEEGSSADEESATKKSVRFNEVVSRNLYRSNSSILGQRKKNQRKQRMKRRSAQRRTSESEGSETEGDLNHGLRVRRSSDTKKGGGEAEKGAHNELIPRTNENGDGKETNCKNEGKEERTILSWEEQERNGNPSDEKKDVINLTNTAIYDLD